MTGAWPENWAQLEAEVERRADPVAVHSPFYGPKHWRAVGRIGIELAARVNWADDRTARLRRPLGSDRAPAPRAYPSIRA